MYTGIETWGGKSTTAIAQMILTNGKTSFIKIMATLRYWIGEYVSDYRFVVNVKQGSRWDQDQTPLFTQA